MTRKKEQSLESMGGAAITAALEDAGIAPDVPTAVYVGNMMSGILSDQQHLGPLLAYAAGMTNVDAVTAEACCGAGGAAFRWGCMAVASGWHETVVVAGVEAMTHTSPDKTTKALATASHWETEGAHGATFVSLNGGLMEQYMEKYAVPHSAFAPFALTAHDNAANSPEAVFHKKSLTEEQFEASMTITPPVQLMDACPTCDGAAAVVLTSNKDIARQADGGFVEVNGSGSACDILPVAERPEPLHLKAVESSARQALAQAGLGHQDMDMFELHDAYTIMACLSLESAGFVEPGQGLQFAADGDIALNGKLPIATFGGLKARGHPVGATGVYQAAEVFLQLAHRAGANQVAGVQTAMMQNIGGAGSSVFTHVLTRG